MGIDAIRAALMAAAAALYIATAAPGAFWLDSGELSAAAMSLGIPHPPGHPLYTLFGYLATWIPLGSLAFRVTLLSAVCGGLAVGWLFDIGRLLGGAMGRVGGGSGTGAGTPDGSPIVAPALAAATFALADALWLQSARAEVYTLHLALSLWVIRGALRWRLSPRSTPPSAGRLAAAGPLAALSFALGLAMGNHHLLVLALLPGLLIIVLSSPQRLPRTARAWTGIIGAGVLPVALYMVLFLRSRAEPLMDYGHPDSLTRLWDVMTARVFQSSVGGAEVHLGANMGAATEMLLDALGPLWLLAAMVGLARLFRRYWSVALGIAVLVAGNLATKVLMVLDPSNPDAAGYLLLAMALGAALGGAAFGGLTRRPRKIAGAVFGTLALALALTRLALMPTVPGDLREHRTPAVWDALVTESIPPGALVMSSHYSFHFNRLHHQVAMGARPDLVAVHQGLDRHIEGGRPYAQRLGAREPALIPMLDAAQGDPAALPISALRALARHRPVRLEPTPALAVPTKMRAIRGPWIDLTPLGQPPAAGGPNHIGIGVGDLDRFQARLTRAAGGDLRRQNEARRTVLIHQLAMAVTLLQAGHGDAASKTMAYLEALSPQNPSILRLKPVADALVGAAHPEARARVRQGIARTDFQGLLYGP